MDCKHCKDDRTGGQYCYVCHMMKKGVKPMRESYRIPDNTVGKKFGDLEEDQADNLEFKEIKFKEEDDNKFAFLKLECKLEGTRAVYSFQDFHKNGDKNFFGDRPAVYGFANYGQDEKVKIGEAKNASQRLRTHKTELKKTTLSKMGKTEGFLLFSCGSGTIMDDPLRSHNLRLVIERLLQINFDVPQKDKGGPPDDEGKKRVEQHVVPDKKELELAVELSEWVFDNARSFMTPQNKEFTTKHS